MIMVNNYGVVVTQRSPTELREELSSPNNVGLRITWLLNDPWDAHKHLFQVKGYTLFPVDPWQIYIS